MKLHGHYEEIPEALRIKDAVTIVIVFALFAIILFLMGYVGESEAFFAWGGLLLILGVALGFYLYRKKQAFIHDPVIPVAPTEEELRAKAEADEKWDRAVKKWWFRYPMAVLFLVGAWFSPEWKPNSWFIPVLFVLGAIVSAWELALVGLGIGIAILAFKALASLPVSVAIIIGAFIIGAAITAALKK
ncbi:MAG: LPXTG cell wall anchor domain-containing protein [Rhodocyclales bacterium]|nr:LPXTG cell wall anchor domain-containing protein [Rhodocyclales bacterium]